MPNREEFAQLVKSKFPEYKDIDNNILVDSVIKKFPEYKAQITDFEKPFSGYELNKPQKGVDIVSTPLTPGSVDTLQKAEEQEATTQLKNIQSVPKEAAETFSEYVPMLAKKTAEALPGVMRRFAPKSEMGAKEGFGKPLPQMTEAEIAESNKSLKEFKDLAKPAAEVALGGAVAGGVLAAPLATIPTVAIFGALDKLVPVEKFIPENADELDKTAIQLIDFIAKGAVAGGITKAAGKAIAPIVDRFTLDKLESFNLPKQIRFSREQVRDIYRGGDFANTERDALWKDLGLPKEAIKKAVEEGITIDIPAEKIVTITDKPYWSKFKSIFGIKESEPIITKEYSNNVKLGPATEAIEFKPQEMAKIAPESIKPVSPTIPIVETQKPIPMATEAQKQGIWSVGAERNFAFDPNSTKNEGRFRLSPPRSVDPNYFQADAFGPGRDFVRSNFVGKTKLPEGIQVVVGKVGGKPEVQAIRFDKKLWPEEKANKWFSDNRKIFNFYTPETPKISTDWYRSVDMGKIGGVDKFFSADKSISGDFGNVYKINEQEMPKNPMTIGSKDELADIISYEGDPYTEKNFDVLAKNYAKERGYDAIKYNEGTMGAPELHIFGDSIPATIEQRITKIAEQSTPEQLERLARATSFDREVVMDKIEQEQIEKEFLDKYNATAQEVAKINYNSFENAVQIEAIRNTKNPFPIFEHIINNGGISMRDPVYSSDMEHMHEPKYRVFVKDGKNAKNVEDMLVSLQSEKLVPEDWSAVDLLKYIDDNRTKFIQSKENKGKIKLYPPPHELTFEKFKKAMESGKINDEFLNIPEGMSLQDYHKLLIDEAIQRKYLVKNSIVQEYPELVEKYSDLYGDTSFEISLMQNIQNKTNIETPEFKAWFGDSKVVDEQGKPLVVYHGSPHKFNEFDTSKIGQTTGTSGLGRGFYFSDNKKLAQSYSPNGGEVYEVFLKIENPLSAYERTITKLQLKNIFKELYKNDPDLLSNYGDVGYEGLRKVLDNAVELEYQNENDVDIFNSIVSGNGNFEITANAFKNITGHDGAIKGPIYVVFSPTQIKSVFNRGTFDPNDANILRSSIAPIWYSKLQKTIEDKMPEKATPQQIYGIIKEVKEEERKWSGIDDFLKGKEKISKYELLDFLRGNELQIKEVTKGRGILPKAGQEITRILPSGDKDFFRVSSPLVIEDGKVQVEYLDGSSKFFIPMEEAHPTDEDLRGARVKEVSTKFSQYQLSGGKNYREILFTLPVIRKQSFEDFLSAYRDRFPNATTSDSDVRKIYSESFATIPPRGSLIAKQESSAFKSSHWDEPNVLAHARINDRIDIDGKKILFIEEIQSDWHQQGREKGYKQKITSQEAEQKLKEGGYFISKTKTGFDIVDREGDKIWTDFKSKDDLLEWAAKRYEAMGSNIPDAPFKQTIGKGLSGWAGFVLKRLIRYAAENGYDRIGWTTGEQQAERYDLSKQISRIVYTKDGKLEAYAKDNPDKQLISEYVPADKISDYIGKDAAQKLTEQPEPTEYKPLELSGLDLKVGGEGMKSFYDKMIPQALNDWGNKFGAKVKTSKILSSSQKYEIPEKIEPIDINSLDLTPAMKESALNEGFSMFQKINPDSEMGKAYETYGKANEVYQKQMEVLNKISQNTPSTIAVDFKKQGHIIVNEQIVKTPNDVASLFSPLRNGQIEKFTAFFTKDDRLIKAVTISSGMSNSVQDISIGYVQGLYDACGANGVWFAHNHPSGLYEPSKEDKFFTLRMAEGNMNVKGHVVTDHDKYTILRPGDIQSTGEFSKPQTDFVPFKKKFYMEDAAMFTRDLINETQSGLVYLDAARNVRAFEQISNDIKEDLLDVISKNLNQNGAAFVQLVTQDRNLADQYKDIFGEFIELGDIVLIEGNDFVSYRRYGYIKDHATSREWLVKPMGTYAIDDKGSVELLNKITNDISSVAQKTDADYGFGVTDESIKKMITWDDRFKFYSQEAKDTIAKYANKLLLAHNFLYNNPKTRPIAEAIVRAHAREIAEITSIEKLAAIARKPYNKKLLADILLRFDRRTDLDLMESMKRFLDDGQITAQDYEAFLAFKALSDIKKRQLIEEIAGYDIVFAEDGTFQVKETVDVSGKPKSKMGIKVKFEGPRYDISYTNRQGELVSRKAQTLPQLNFYQKRFGEANVQIDDYNEMYTLQNRDALSGEMVKERVLAKNYEEIAVRLNRRTQRLINELLPYQNRIPHSRPDGDYWVDVFSKTDKEHPISMRLKNKLYAEKAKQIIEKELPGNYEVRISPHDKRDIARPHLSSLLDVVIFLKDKAGIDPESDVAQKIINAYRSTSSLYSSLIHSKNIPGFRRDYDGIIDATLEEAKSAIRRSARNDISDAKRLLKDIGPEDGELYNIANSYLNLATASGEGSKTENAFKAGMYFLTLTNNIKKSTQDLSEPLWVLTRENWGSWNDPYSILKPLDEEFKSLEQRAIYEGITKPFFSEQSVKEKNILHYVDMLGRWSESTSSKNIFNIFLKKARDMGLSGDQAYDFAVEHFFNEGKPFYFKANVPLLFFGEKGETALRWEAFLRVAMMYMRYPIDTMNKSFLLPLMAKDYWKFIKSNLVWVILAGFGTTPYGREILKKMGILDEKKNPKSMTTMERAALGGTLGAMGLESQFMAPFSMKGFEGIFDVTKPYGYAFHYFPDAYENSKKYGYGLGGAALFSTPVVGRYAINYNKAKEGFKKKVAEGGYLTTYKPSGVIEKAAVTAGFSPFAVEQQRIKQTEKRKWFRR